MVLRAFQAFTGTQACAASVGLIYSEAQKVARWLRMLGFWVLGVRGSFKGFCKGLGCQGFRVLYEDNELPTFWLLL